MADDAEIPPYQDFLWPAVMALRVLGGSASIDELVEQVILQEGYSEEQQAVLHGGGPRTEIEYRLAWARTYLKGMGLADNSQRGVWSLTEAGLNVEPEQIQPMRQKYIAAIRSKNGGRPRRKDTTPDSEGFEESWEDQLLARIMRLSPASFERLAQRLLREAGFINTQVTGRSGDGGIDGLGVYRLSLVSFPVFFQCKRYVGSVGSGDVRDFRGAMAGRGDKGLLITTGTFTAEAKNEATRDGAPPVDLIDGSRLCGLLKEYELGVKVTTHIVEDIRVDEEFFDTAF
ncbi:restriction system protein [Arthrobacter globiformis]|uniref:restriction endonuclease n=1 Tax=Arthrobacter globiformis TaxID=1665 RepID=UPI00278738A5|nr:restriction endonuclease [Arthrobacter globiformis]MDQ1060774.1 restriction system protein [Arthrobacter globiformis]